jgi:hypothetical protein
MHVESATHTYGSKRPFGRCCTCLKGYRMLRSGDVRASSDALVCPSHRREESVWEDATLEASSSRAARAAVRAAAPLRPEEPPASTAAAAAAAAGTAA